jgi:hypothetical protein
MRVVRCSHSCVVFRVHKLDHITADNSTLIISVRFESLQESSCGTVVVGLLVPNAHEHSDRTYISLRVVVSLALSWSLQP